MRNRSRVLATGLALVLSTALAACGDDDDDTETATETTTEETTAETTATTAASGPSVEITEPADGATVASPVTLKMAATNFTIEPAGDGTVKEGHGHFHVMIDTACLAGGTVIPSDATHVHYGKAQLEAPLELAAGEHTLCLQVGDGAHSALDLTDEVKVTVQ